ncbi:MAG: peptidoglycan recognition family protein [Mycobacterium sp.]
MADLTRRDTLRLAGGLGLAAMTQTALPTVASAAPTTVSGVMLGRDAWGARPPRSGGRPHTIDRMTIHPSAVALPDNRVIAARLRQHQRYHQDDKGWVDIAYHAAVDRRGNIFALRSTAIAGDTATDYDTTGHFLILCEGDFDDETVTEAQLEGAALVGAWATRQFGISSATLASHREVTAVTSCPGRNLEEHVASGDLKSRIDTLIAGGFQLTPVSGPQAAAIVAGIESG